MKKTKWSSFAEAKRCREKAEEGKAAQSLTRKEVEKQIQSGKLTEEQAIELRQKYMDSLEYNEEQQFVTNCGGIKPLPVLLPPDEED